MSKKERPNTYEWKEDYDVIPASNITHINVENMSFALNLRRSEAAPPLMSPGKDRIALLERAKKMREQAVSGRNKGDSLPASAIGQLVKDNGCKSNVCKQVVVDIFNTHEDTKALKLRMKDLIESFKEDTLILAQLSKDYENISEIQQTLLKTLSKLDVDVDTLQRKAQTQKDEQKLLERQIVEANEKLRRAKLKQSGQPDPAASTPFPESATTRGALTDAKSPQKKKGKPSKVHTGHFGMYDGRNQWSCCLADREDAPGCVANDSADSLSVLARIKNVFHNQSKVTPLQAHSYRDSAQHHILRYPMLSTDNLNVSFDDEENGFVQQVTSSSAAKVSIELPPRPSRRPQTAHPTGVPSSTAGRFGSTPNSHTQSANHFAPSSSFFTSASAHAMDQSLTLDHKRLIRPQSASPMSHFRSDSHHELHETSHAQPPRRPVSASATPHHHHHHSSHAGHHHSGQHHHSGHQHHHRSHHHHSGHHHHHHRHHHHSHTDLDSPFTKSIYNGSTVIETRPKVLPQNTLMKSFRDNKVGQVRTLPPQEGALSRTNRPMSSPAGYGLYRDQQMQHHQPDLVPETLQASTSILQLTGYSPHSHYWSSTPSTGDPNARPATASAASAQRRR